MPFASILNRLDRLPESSVRLRRGVAVAVVATQGLIAVTGSVVRVTASGLGCPTWPQCFPGSMVPVEHPEYATLNQWIEYGNRLFTGVVGIIAIAAFVLAYRSRPRRDRYLRLAAAMPIGVLVQAVLGGITVRLDLLWWTVAVHFLVSAVMVWLATLHLAAVDEGDAEPRPLAPAPVRPLLVVLAALLVGLLTAGTLVTGAGPHAGDPQTPRLDLPVPTLAHTHAAFLYAFLGCLAVIGVLLAAGRVGRSLWLRFGVLVVVVCAQGTLGFVQYALGVPELLVSLHVLGAMLVITATALLWCGARDRGPRPEITETGSSRAGDHAEGLTVA